MNKCILLLVTFVFFLFGPFVEAQERKVIDMADILDLWIKVDSVESFGKYDIVFDKLNAFVQSRLPKSKIDSIENDTYIYHYLVEKYGSKIKKDSLGGLIIEKPLHFWDIKTQEPLSLYRMSIPYFGIDNSQIESFDLDSVTCDYLMFGVNQIPSTSFVYRSIIKERIDIVNQEMDQYLSIILSGLPDNVFISSNSIGTLNLYQNYHQKLANKIQWNFVDGRYLPSVAELVHEYEMNEQDAKNELLLNEEIKIHFQGNESQTLYLGGNFLPRHQILTDSKHSKLGIEYNNFSAINIRSSSEFDVLNIEKNQINSGIILGKYLSQVAYEIDWADIKGKIRIEENDSLFTSSSFRVASNFPLFKNLSKVYSQLHTYYKSIGLNTQANECYVEWKDMQSVRLKYIYKNEGGFENFYRWKLNQLLKFYANYGTSPAKSIVISTYIILGFAIFYFFFPSEWDTKSKARLIADFKILVSKNENGYFIPFLNLVLGFLISLFNAFTLSLNSFVTLGFGKIPTKGVARYVCIIQGFLGWFLLSIFTVALVSQVLE